MKTRISVTLLAILGALFLAGCDRGLAPSVTATAETEAISAVDLADTDQIHRLTWRQLEKALADISTDPRLRASVLDRFDPGSASAGSLYLVAMIRIALEEPLSANSLFNRIGLEELPARYAYAPYRLQEQLGLPGNRYLEPMHQAAFKGQVRPLLAARVFTRAGAKMRALESYLETDPGNWTSYDLANLQLLHNHDGMRPDTVALIQQARATGRLSPAIEEGFATFLKDPRVAPSANALASKYAAQSVEEILSLRRAFMSRDFKTMIERYADRDVRAVSDEINLMLVVAAAASDNTKETSRWSVELKRRFPDEETRAWLSNLLQG